MMEVVHLRTEYRENPVGLDSINPRLGWEIKSDHKNVIQRKYQIQAAESEDFSSIKWDSGEVETDLSQQILYGGPCLCSMECVWWRVRIWSNSEDSDYSKPAFFQMGLLDKSDWKAKWIDPEKSSGLDVYKPASYIRKEFKVKHELKSAYVYLSAKGLYTFYLNGQLGTKDLFLPGFTSYYKRLQYQVYDIKPFLHEGINVLGIIIGDGWWRGSTGLEGLKNNFGYKVAFLGQIVLEYNDGSKEIIGSDSSFKTSTGPILKSDLMAGEIYDARKELSGWAAAGYDDSDWEYVNETKDSFENLIATRSVPVRSNERFIPKVLKTPNGETVLDFGQNICGWVEITVQGASGAQIIMKYGETLDKFGNFTIKNLNHLDNLNDFQEVIYILKGNGIECYHPHFAVFGFRYVLLEGYDAEIKPENFTAVAIYSAMDETGFFTCSNSMINQLVSNSIWSQKGNFLDVPTDCPTRERAGWSGDAQVYFCTASDFMNVYPFFEKWMADVKAEQYENGAVGCTVPNVLWVHNLEEADRLLHSGTENPLRLYHASTPGKSGIFDGSAGWGDAAVIIPWMMYLCYGDKKILEQQYDSAKAWVDYINTCAKTDNELYKDTPQYKNYTNGERDSDYIWDTGFHWGEWLEADVNLGEFAFNMEEFISNRMKLSDPLVATAYYAYSSHLLAKIASILGKENDAATYGEISKKVKRVYDKYFINEDGSILEGRQAPNVRALAFDLACKEKRQKVADQLAKMIVRNEYHLNTGFLSTPFILHTLNDTGYSELAFKLLEQDTIPSWLYAVTKGATTIWETWRGISPDGDVFGSFNHYAYGAVCDFLFAGIAGIRPVIEDPGYKHFEIMPTIGGSLSFAEARYQSLYGTIESSWKITEHGTSYMFTIPANTRATIMLPGRKEDLRIVLKSFNGARFENKRIVFEAGSGSYKITI